MLGRTILPSAKHLVLRSVLYLGFDLWYQTYPYGKDFRTSFDDRITPMTDPASPRPIIVLGPTAGRKTELAAAMCDALGGEVISADSMQIYRHLDAGTGKPSPLLRSQVRHHLIDIVEPTERFTVADWLEKAQQLIRQLQVHHSRPIIVGGTNLYLKVLLQGMFAGPPSDPALRFQLESTPAADLYQQLTQVDSESALRIAPNDRKRVIRALEIHHQTGTPISQLQTQWSEKSEIKSKRPENRSILIGLDWPVDAINRRINLRVKAMFDPDKTRMQDSVDWWPTESLPQETRHLEESGLLGLQARQALGYKQVLEWVHGRRSLHDAFEQTKIQTRRFAKQQRGWLRQFRQVHWLAAAECPIPDLTRQALQAVKAADQHPTSP